MVERRVVGQARGWCEMWPARGNGHRKSIYRRTAQKIVGIALVAFLCLIAPATALDIEYCSSQNTGSDFKKVTDIYQSHGACQKICRDKYAFAIVQGNQCWCSNYAPSLDNKECTEGCPGYPDEKCGNTKEKAFAYLALTLPPSGTIDATTKATVSSTTVPPPPPPPLPPEVTTVTEEKEGSKETVTIATTPKSTDDDTTSTTTPIVSVITKTGGVQTVTLAPSDTADANKDPATFSSSNSGISAGAIAGIVIGILAALIFLIAALFFYRHRKKRIAEDAEAHHEKISAGGAGILSISGAEKRRSRSLSTMGLVASDKASPASSGSGVLADARVPAMTVNGVGGPMGAGQNQQQQGAADVYDPRLDPGTLFMRYDHATGSSRMSVRSLRDDADYSRRVLRLANPDDDIHT